jgi:hypothetical protein
MSAPAYPVINGYVPSYASVEVNLGGDTGGTNLPGVKSISYKEALAMSRIYGNSVNPQGRTRGQLTASGSIEFYRDQWDAVIALLSGTGSWGFSEKQWTLNITYAETPLTTACDVLIGVRFHSPDTSPAEGTEALTVKCEMDVMQVKWNGVGQLSNLLTFSAMLP